MATLTDLRTVLPAALLLGLCATPAFAQPTSARTPNLQLPYSSDERTNRALNRIDEVAGTGWTWERFPIGTATCAAATGTPDFVLTPTASVMYVTVDDTDGCTLQMSETGAVTGTRVTVVRTPESVGSLVFASISGQQVASATFVMAQSYDNVTFFYYGDRWIEIGKGNL